MASNVGAVLAFGVGFAGGWAARSLADSPQGVGVKLMEIGMHAKERIGQWAAVERERLEDMMAEAHAGVQAGLAAAPASGKTNGSGHRPKPVSEEAEES
jgi:hypothetical protein